MRTTGPFHDQDRLPTPWGIIEHVRLIADSDLSYPIILDQAGRVMDGMHRVCKAVLEGSKEIAVVQFETDPAPDHVACDVKQLRYEAG